MSRREGLLFNLKYFCFKGTNPRPPTTQPYPSPKSIHILSLSTSLVGKLKRQEVSVRKLLGPCVGTLQLPRITGICRNFVYPSYAVLHLPAPGQGFCAQHSPWFSTYFADRSSFATCQREGIPGGDRGRLVLPRVNGGEFCFVKCAWSHQGSLVRTWGRDGQMDVWRRFTENTTPAGACAGPLYPFLWVGTMQHRLWTVERLSCVVCMVHGKRRALVQVAAHDERKKD